MRASVVRAIWGSTSTTALTPARRIAGAAAASRRPAAAASARGLSVFATSWARWRPRRRSSGAGPSRSAPFSSPFSSRRSALGRLCVRAGGDDRDQVPERRVAELAPPVELLRQEPGDVVAGGVAQRRRIRLEGLHDHLARRVAAAAAGELRDELKRPLLRPEVRAARAPCRRRRPQRARRRGSGGPWRPSACRRGRRGRRRRSGRAPRGARPASPPCPRRAGSARAPAPASRARTRASASRRRSAPARTSRTPGRPRARPPSSRSGGSAAARRRAASARRRTGRSAARRPQARQWIAGARPRRLRSRIALPPCSEIRPSSSSSGAESG